jgi:hypothetical protein
MLAQPVSAAISVAARKKRLCVRILLTLLHKQLRHSSITEQQDQTASDVIRVKRNTQVRSLRRNLRLKLMSGSLLQEQRDSHRRRVHFAIEAETIGPAAPVVEAHQHIPGRPPGDLSRCHIHITTRDIAVGQVDA